MDRKIPSGLLAVFLALAIVCSFDAAPAWAQSHDVANAVGKSVVTQINCDEQAGGGKPYDATLALLEFVRGPEAWKRLKEASGSNAVPREGHEYILARISFQMKPRGAPGDKTFDLGRPLQSTAFSEDLATEYETPAVVLPKPELKRRVRANEPAEGWIAFQVRQDDSKPLMLFDPSRDPPGVAARLIFLGSIDG